MLNVDREQVVVLDPDVSDDTTEVPPRLANLDGAVDEREVLGQLLHRELGGAGKCHLGDLLGRYGYPQQSSEAIFIL